jgi:hypothetical protein
MVLKELLIFKRDQSQLNSLRSGYWGNEFMFGILCWSAERSVNN